MKAMQKYIHLTLIVALLLGSFGFRVNMVRCDEKKASFSTSMAMRGKCCCSKATKPVKKTAESCNDITCVMQRSLASESNFNTSSKQEVQADAQPVSYPSFTGSIRPVLLESIPHVTLPPPLSGRDITILHQTFLI